MLTEHEVPLLKALGAAPFKITLPAPSNFVPTGFKPGVTDRHYKDRDALLADLVAIVATRSSGWSARASRYIQLDAPFYSHYLDPQHREAMRQSGGDPDADFEAAVAGDNAALGGVSRDRA